MPLEGHAPVRGRGVIDVDAVHGSRTSPTCSWYEAAAGGWTDDMKLTWRGRWALDPAL